MKTVILPAVFALGIAMSLLTPVLLSSIALADDETDSQTYNLEWEKLARDPEFRKAIAIVINEACIVNNSIIYCD